MIAQGPLRKEELGGQAFSTMLKFDNGEARQPLDPSVFAHGPVGMVFGYPPPTKIKLFKMFIHPHDLDLFIDHVLKTLNSLSCAASF